MLSTPAQRAARARFLAQKLADVNRLTQLIPFSPAMLAVLRSPFLDARTKAAPPGPGGPDSFMPASFWQSQNPTGSKEVGWTLCCATVKRMVGYNAPLRDRLQIVREHGRSLVLQPTAQQGIDMLDHYLALRRPVMAGVTHTYAAGYNLGAPDYGTTDHFVAIVGTGTDAKGKYYRFFDVGTKNKYKANGIDPRNRLYYDARTGSYSGKSIATGRNYILSQLRFKPGTF